MGRNRSNLPLVVDTALHPPRALENHPIRANPIRVIRLTATTSSTTTCHCLCVTPRRCSRFDHPCSNIGRRQNTSHPCTADDVLADRFRALHRVGAGDSPTSSSLHLRRLVRAEGRRSSVSMHGKTRLRRHRRRKSRAVVLAQHARRRDERGVLRRWDEHRRGRGRRLRSDRSLLLLLLFESLLPLLGSETRHRILPPLLHLIGRFHTCVRVRPYASLGSDGGLLIRHGRIVRGRKFLLHTDRTSDYDAAHWEAKIEGFHSVSVPVENERESRKGRLTSNPPNLPSLRTRYRHGSPKQQ